MANLIDTLNEYKSRGHSLTEKIKEYQIHIDQEKKSLDRLITFGISIMEDEIKIGDKYVLILDVYLSSKKLYYKILNSGDSGDNEIEIKKITPKRVLINNPGFFVLTKKGKYSSRLSDKNVWVSKEDFLKDVYIHTDFFKRNSTLNKILNE